MKAVAIKPYIYKNYFKNENYNFEDVTLTSGTATFENDALDCITSKAVKVNVGSYLSTDVVFNYGLKTFTEVINTGNYFISFAIKSVIAFDFEVNVVVNGGLPIVLSAEVDALDYWQNLTQSLPLTRGDEVNISFKVLHDAGGTSNSFNFLLDSLRLEENNAGLGVPSLIIPNQNKTGWQSRVDVVNTVALPIGENVLAITGAVESNGNVNLLDANSKIVPENLGDVIQVDFSCTFVTPAGSDKYVEIKLVVDGVVYRGNTHLLLKGDGNDDYFSLSYSLPVGDAFINNGVSIVISPSAEMSYKNRYIQATLIHKGV